MKQPNKNMGKLIIGANGLNEKYVYEVFVNGKNAITPGKTQYVPVIKIHKSWAGDMEKVIEAGIRAHNIRKGVA